MNKLIRLLCALALFAAYVAPAADIIPAGNLITWVPGTDVGVPGGIPTGRTVVNITGLDSTGATDVSSALQGWIDAATTGQKLVLPAGTFRTDSTLTFPATNSNITLAGSGVGVTIIKSRSNVGVLIGVATGMGLPSGYVTANATVSSGLTKGSTQLTIGNTGWLADDDLVLVSTENDATVPELSTSGFKYEKHQLVRVTAVDSGTTFSFTPGLYSAYGGGSLDVVTSRALGSAGAGKTDSVGLESMTVDMDDSAASDVTAISIQQAYACWLKEVQINNTKNYPISIEKGLHIEVRRCFVNARKGGGTNGGGVLMAFSSGCLVEDNIIISNNPNIEVNSGSSGNRFSRNFTYNGFILSNHSAYNQFNLYDANVGPFLSDGYHGGERFAMYVANKISIFSLKRGSYDFGVVANFVERATDGNRLGDPNISNESSVGTVYPPSTKWADFGMTGTITAVTKGTGTGYLVNNSGGYPTGTTTISLDTGTGTILAGDVVTFSGSPGNRYTVATALSGGTITLTEYGGGLTVAVADNEAVTVSSDKGTLTLASGYTLTVGDGPKIHYGSPDELTQLFRVTAASGTNITIGPFYANNSGQPNLYEIPAVSTAVRVGRGPEGFQELDGGVASTITRIGNRYEEGGTYESPGSDSLNSIFVETVKPQWLLDQETEFSATFNLNPFNAILRTSASESDIPAGYRYYYTTPPEETGASINVAGTQLTLTANKPLAVGAGGSGGVSIGGDITATFDSTSGSSVIFNLSRPVSDEESFTIDYLQPGNGLEDSLGNDLASFSGMAVVNYSGYSAGASWVQVLEWDAGDSSANLSSIAAIVQPIVIPSDGYVTKIRVGIAAGGYGTRPGKVALLDASGTVLSSSEFLPDKWFTASGGYEVFDIPSIHVTAGTYKIAVLADSNAEPPVVYLSGQPSGTSSYSIAEPFASWPATSVVSSGESTVKYAVGLRLVPDAVATSAAAATVNVGTLQRIP